MLSSFLVCVFVYELAGTGMFVLLVEYRMCDSFVHQYRYRDDCHCGLIENKQSFQSLYALFRRAVVERSW